MKLIILITLSLQLLFLSNFANAQINIPRPNIPGPNFPRPNFPRPNPPVVVSPTTPETAKVMWCRTPLSYTPGLTMHVYYSRSEVAAGYNGENLKPGTCGWNDQALSSNDPVDLIVAMMPNSPAPTDGVQTLWTAEINAKASAIASALVQPDVYIVFNAYVYKDLFMMVKDSQFTVKPILK